MVKIGQIGLLHVIFLIMTFIGLKNHVTILPPVLEHVKRDGWAAVLLATFLTIPWLFLILFIQNKSKNQSIKTWLKSKIGKVATNIILYCVVIFIYLMAAFTLRETILWISSTFLPYTPKILLLAVYITLCVLLASTNMQTFVIVNTFVLMFVVVFGFYVATVNLQVKDYGLIRPFFEHGFGPVLRGLVYPASGFIELFLLVFIQQHFKTKLKWYHLLIMLFILMGLTMGPLLGAIVEFGPEEAAKQRYPAFEEWALVSIGRFIEQMDFLSIYQWLTGTYIRVSFLLFIAADILNFTGNRKKIWNYMIPPFVIINLVVFMLDDSLFLHLNGNEMLIATFSFFFLLSILFSLIALLPDKKNKNQSTSNQSNNQSNNNKNNNQSDNIQYNKQSNDNKSNNQPENNQSENSSSKNQSESSE
ncbi:GerAB/ArcD/ProY family transporter [Lysinibacillus endophyticus]|uniref:GerAB/ArcD/ProY family transporter n=1 Tax=Ureibacillus endophyticus TaxID=1978490 RepID=UPI00209C845A|nr:endospore germination permease [Lysinibacillus endophyticus]MCP1144636.1 endospore germination permease [Lysinibacillus endophyticus]